MQRDATKDRRLQFEGLRAQDPLQARLQVQARLLAHPQALADLPARLRTGAHTRQAHTRQAHARIHPQARAGIRLPAHARMHPLCHVHIRLQARTGIRLPAHAHAYPTRAPRALSVMPEAHKHHPTRAPRALRVVPEARKHPHQARPPVVMLATGTSAEEHNASAHHPNFSATHHALFCTRHCYETLYRTDSLHATNELTAVSASDAQRAPPFSMSLGSPTSSMSLGSKHSRSGRSPVFRILPLN